MSPRQSARHVRRAGSPTPTCNDHKTSPLLLPDCTRITHPEPSSVIDGRTQAIRGSAAPDHINSLRAVHRVMMKTTLPRKNRK